MICKVVQEVRYQLEIRFFIRKHGGILTSLLGNYIAWVFLVIWDTHLSI